MCELSSWQRSMIIRWSWHNKNRRKFFEKKSQWIMIDQRGKKERKKIILQVKSPSSAAAAAAEREWQRGEEERWEEDKWLFTHSLRRESQKNCWMNQQQFTSFWLCSRKLKLPLRKVRCQHASERERKRSEMSFDELISLTRSAQFFLWVR